MKKFVFALLTTPLLAAAACPQWVGRAEAYAVGTTVGYNGSNYKVARSMSSGWVNPTDTWFWQATTETCGGGSGTSDAAVAVLQQMLAELVAVKNSNSQILAALSAGSAVPTEFTDARDGKKYPVVKIGSTVWMASDLLFAADQATCKTTSCRYSWALASQVCPSGWHLPSKAQLDELLAIGGDYGTQLRSRTGWAFVPGTNQLGFSALPVQGVGGGSQDGSTYATQWVDYWSGTQSTVDDGKAYAIILGNNRSTSMTTTPPTVVNSGSADVRAIDKAEAMSVRCAMQ